LGTIQLCYSLVSLLLQGFFISCGFKNSPFLPLSATIVDNQMTTAMTIGIIVPVATPNQHTQPQARKKMTTGLTIALTTGNGRSAQVELSRHPIWLGASDKNLFAPFFTVITHSQNVGQKQLCKVSDVFGTACLLKHYSITLKPAAL
jgi:hypothetical protein